MRSLFLTCILALFASAAAAQPAVDFGRNGPPGSGNNSGGNWGGGGHNRLPPYNGGNWGGGGYNNGGHYNQRDWNFTFNIPLTPPRIPQSPGYGYGGGYGYQPQPYTVYEWRCWGEPTGDHWGRVWTRQVCGNVPVTYWR